jgi:hypothetical protein
LSLFSDRTGGTSLHASPTGLSSVHPSAHPCRDYDRSSACFDQLRNYPSGFQAAREDIFVPRSRRTRLVLRFTATPELYDIRALRRCDAHGTNDPGVGADRCRHHLPLRHDVAAVGRRVLIPCNREANLRSPLHLDHTYDNVCLPHLSLRAPLACPEPTKGRGSIKRWHRCAPAIAAGLTDRVWALREVLLFRVPPWPQPQGR